MKGLKGIKKVAGESQRINNYVLQLNYDVRTGELWTDTHESTNSRSHYNDLYILNVGYLTCPHTMREIRDMVVDALEDHIRWLYTLLGRDETHAYVTALIKVKNI